MFFGHSSFLAAYRSYFGSKDDLLTASLWWVRVNVDCENQSLQNCPNSKPRGKHSQFDRYSILTFRLPPCFRFDCRNPSSGLELAHFETHACGKRKKKGPMSSIIQRSTLFNALVMLSNCLAVEDLLVVQAQHQGNPFLECHLRGFCTDVKQHQPFSIQYQQYWQEHARPILESRNTATHRNVLHHVERHDGKGDSSTWLQTFLLCSAEESKSLCFDGAVARLGGKSIICPRFGAKQGVRLPDWSISGFC